METNGLLIQDLSDMLHINQQRVIGFNKSAYGCGNLHLKMLLNREVDQARDAVFSLKQLLSHRFNPPSALESTGQLLSMWLDFKPSFNEAEINTQLHAFEMADLLTLQCYRLAIARPYLDVFSKNLLEFQYEKSVSTYATIKAFRQAYRNAIQNSMQYPQRKMA